MSSKKKRSEYAQKYYATRREYFQKKAREYYWPKREPQARQKKYESEESVKERKKECTKTHRPIWPTKKSTEAGEDG